MTGATSKCICGVQPPENDLTTIFVCYFLHVRSSVGREGVVLQMQMVMTMISKMMVMPVKMVMTMILKMMVMPVKSLNSLLQSKPLTTMILQQLQLNAVQTNQAPLSYITLCICNKSPSFAETVPRQSPA